MPRQLPDGGLLLRNEGSLRFGVWVMPDNASDGGLETFLRHLVPTRVAPIWSHAEQSTVRARELGADYRDAHFAKARMHTWLAWQDPPGRPLGVALTAKVLDPHSPGAQPFVNWFRTLYDLEPVVA